MSAIVLETHCPNLKLRHRGKVRDVYEDGDRLLIAATDRISAFDVVMPNGIPDKGKMLTSISAFWFDRMDGVVPHHLISTNADDFPQNAQPYRDQLEGRTMLVRKTNRIDVECVVRGYITGSAWSEYRKQGTVCGEKLPAGLRESEKFPTPLFTPATKADEGHDENISIDTMRELVGDDLTDELIEASVTLYERGAAFARERGILIADTKFEFGLVDGEIMLIDEILTPDSSRFWPLDEYEVGRSQRSFDKQFVRDYLNTLDWNKQPPGPELPTEVVEGTARRYREAYELLIG
ncbi:MAG: phosphoribosylaminoimidazolesuccinocarboxamide synthase [Candidatus Poribacteria bacterium]|nr:phosphoribosylaminoimidazolesuccinocarboxamide synthase [Candidatus Poribacteria bacterium]